jgi:peptidoglycan-associated lipoprotein
MKLSANKLLILILLIFPSIIVGQKRNPAASADDAFSKQQYYSALEKYKKALKKVKKNKEEKNRITYQMAECYRLTENYKRAEISYKRLIRNEYEKRDPKIILWYAQMLQMNGKYAEAVEFYNKYAELVPDDPRGKKGAEDALLVQEWFDNPSKYEVSNVKKINSKNADFAPAFYNSTYQEIVFTSTREGTVGKEDDQWTGQKFSDLFVARKDKNGEWTAPVLLDNNPKGNEKNKIKDTGTSEKDLINTKANEGSATLNTKFKKLYFTRCKNTPKVQSGCQIYVATRTGRNWGNVKMLEIKGIDTLSTIGQPTISEDELTIFFAGDLRKGYGGKDIYYATRTSKNKSFGRPVNLGPVINTIGDEMFPFLRNDTTLYFASTGHGGMGGLDIFITTKDTSGNWKEPKNLKYPINSQMDDFGIVFHPEEEWGYLSSNRKGTKGNEDIWYFIEPPLLFTLSGTVKDDRTLFTIKDAEVNLVGSNGISVTTRTNDQGFYSFTSSQIKPNVTYEIIVSKPDYFKGKATLTTAGVEFSKDFEKNFILKPIPDEPIVLPDILYDLGKWDLKPQYQDSLQELIQTLRDNPRLVIELASHTDSRDSEERNDILSQKRAQSVVDYLIIRGINPQRLVAKGYGERVPRTLKKDVIKDGFLFKKGTTLDDTFIYSLPSKAQQEAAHALNRRTEFRVLRRDFVPNKNVNPSLANVNIAINPEDNTTPFAEDEKTGTYLVPCLINSYRETFAYDKPSIAMVSLDKALDLLRNRAISKDDFEGDVEEILKNNTISDRAVINLKEVRIANRTVNDIKVRVNYKLNFDFVFGDEVLKMFGKYKFDTKTNKLIFEK